MVKLVKSKLIFTVLIASLLVTSCGTKNATETVQETNRIETAVAATVSAQNAAQVVNTSTPAAPVATQTPLKFSPTFVQLTAPPSPTLPANAPKSKCASASLVSETIPDGTIFKPGAQFTKTWEIKNTSPCTWDTTYKIVFFDGDMLGGATYYNLPQIVGSGQTFPLSLVLTAPKGDASYTSKWKLETPDGIKFGVGEYSAPFYTEIAVSSATNPNYGVTSVDFNLVRDPAVGCPANVTYTLYATVATSGPVELTYLWLQSDGNNSNPKTVKIKSATTTTFKREWKLHIATNTGIRWIAFATVSPESREYPHQTFLKDCGG